MKIARHQKASGFTLIELLVVVSIITALMGILMPSLSQARKQANDTACLQVLHGLSIGMRTYLDENGQIYPRSAQLPSMNAIPPDAYEPLPISLASQVNSPKAWRCPGDKKGYLRASDNKSFDSYFAGETISYEYNISLGGIRIPKHSWYDVLGEVNMPLLADADFFHGEESKSASKHILYADGHVGPVDEMIKNLGKVFKSE